MPISSSWISFDCSLTTVTTFCLPFFVVSLSNVSSLPFRLIVSLKVSSSEPSDAAETSTEMSLPAGPASRAEMR